MDINELYEKLVLAGNALIAAQQARNDRDASWASLVLANMIDGCNAQDAWFHASRSEAGKDALDLTRLAELDLRKASVMYDRAYMNLRTAQRIEGI